MTSLATLAPNVFVTSRYVAVAEHLIRQKYDLLHHFQVEERVNEYAARNNTRETRRVPLYEAFNYQGQKYLRFPRFMLTRLTELYRGITDYGYLMPAAPPSAPLPAFQVASTFASTDIQRQIGDYIFAHHYTEAAVRECRASCIVELDTGLGKTYLSLEVFRRLAQPAAGAYNPGVQKMLIITLTHQLANQAQADLRSCLPPAEHDLVVTEATQFCRICILNIDAAIAVSDPALFNCFDLVVFDEVPTFCTPSRRSIFFRKCRFSLGVTAEPNSRSDALDPIFHAHLGSLIGQQHYDRIEDPIDCKLIQHTYRADTKIEPVRNKTTKSLSFLESLEKCLALDDARNAEIIRISKALMAKRFDHFIFAHHLSHVDILRRLVTAGLPTARIFVLTGDTGSDPQATAKLRAANIVIATYSAAKYGVSKSDAFGIICAEPPFQVSYKQVVGRVKRFSAELPEQNKIVREVHTIVDFGHYWLRTHQEALRSYFGAGDTKKEEHESMAGTSAYD